ncbi:unnamed protein product [Microthlaspi erraticum]|uniref:Uncharacterized protein n=1 Tax=Microthlaspi erraticum TaxID=1685480 RepID=A0A6D2HZF9_9BRAS|nr:unnamed protein product [Microthlaspi erraticum]
MFRAMSTRKIRGGYEKLGEEEPRLKRVTSVPASVYGNSRSPIVDVKKPTTPSSAKSSGGSVHPLFSFFDVRFQRKKKKTPKKSSPTAKPEFARYMEYVKEGGVWDPNSNSPVIHYR